MIHIKTCSYLHISTYVIADRCIHTCAVVHTSIRPPLTIGVLVSMVITHCKTEMPFNVLVVSSFDFTYADMSFEAWQIIVYCTLYIHYYGVWNWLNKTALVSCSSDVSLINLFLNIVNLRIMMLYTIRQHNNIDYILSLQIIWGKRQITCTHVYIHLCVCIWSRPVMPTQIKLWRSNNLRKMTIFRRHNLYENISLEIIEVVYQ